MAKAYNAKLIEAKCAIIINNHNPNSEQNNCNYHCAALTQQTLTSSIGLPKHKIC